MRVKYFRFSAFIGATIAAVGLFVFSCGAPSTRYDPKAYSLMVFREERTREGLVLRLSRDYASVFGSWEETERGTYGIAEGEAKDDGTIRLHLYGSGQGYLVGTFEGRYESGERVIEGEVSYSVPESRVDDEAAVGEAPATPSAVARPLAERRKVRFLSEPSEVADLFALRLRDTTKNGLPADSTEPTRFIYTGFEFKTPRSFRDWYRTTFQGGSPIGKAMAIERDAFFSDFGEAAKAFTEADPQIPVHPWYYEGRQFIGFSTPRLFLMGLRLATYTGGANGNSGIRYALIDRRDARILGPGDFFADGWEKAIPSLLESRARIILGLEPGSSLKQAGFFEDTLPLGGNFFLTSSGFGFHYNSYEVAPGVYGDFWIVLPWADIEDILKPGALDSYGLGALRPNGGGGTGSP